MPTDTKWLYCEYCGQKTQHKKLPTGLYRCVENHEKTQIALDRISKGEDLKKKPKGRK